MSAKETARCKELHESLANVKKQYETFTRTLDDAARTGTYDKAQELAGTLDKELSALENRLHPLHAGFLKKTFERWYNKEVAEKAELKPTILASTNVVWKKLSNDIDPKKFGEYTLNPETSHLTTTDFERLEREGKINVLELTELHGKLFSEVGEYLALHFPSSHIPGIEFWQWIIENPDKAPTSLKDGNYHFFFGSLLRGSGGSWVVPYAYWNDSEFRRNASWLAGEWDANYRVVLVEI